MVPEAFAFDYLSILAIKLKHGLPVSDEFYEQCFLLQDEIPQYAEVLDSPEYVALYDANLNCWNMVDKATRDECKASEVDKANQARYEAKRALQRRFWPASKLTEVKAERPQTN